MPGYFYANERLQALTFDELEQSAGGEKGGGFLPAVKQIANVAALPGIVKVDSVMYREESPLPEIASLLITR